MARLVSADGKQTIETESPRDIVQLKAQGFSERAKPGPKPADTPKPTK